MERSFLWVAILIAWVASASAIWMHLTSLPDQQRLVAPINITMPTPDITIQPAQVAAPPVEVFPAIELTPTINVPKAEVHIFAITPHSTPRPAPSSPRYRRSHWSQPGWRDCPWP
jgi:hypothetical protein